MKLENNTLLDNGRLIAVFYDKKIAEEVLNYYQRKEKLKQANKILAEVDIEDYPVL